MLLMYHAIQANGETIYAASDPSKARNKFLKLVKQGVINIKAIVIDTKPTVEEKPEG
jgi:hypothetical protein